MKHLLLLFSLHLMPWLIVVDPGLKWVLLSCGEEEERATKAEDGGKGIEACVHLSPGSAATSLMVSLPLR